MSKTARLDPPASDFPDAVAAVAAKTGKRAGFLQAAKLEFLENGYEATSMDAVARRAGTTKRTLYAYFSSKDALYQDIADYAGELFVHGIPVPDPKADDLAGELGSFCAAVLANMAWTDAVALQRMVLGSAPKFPDLPGKLYDVSFGEATRRLAACLTSAAKAGRLPKPSPTAKGAAQQLLLMTTGQVHQETLMGVRESLPGPPGPVTLRAIDGRAIARAVEAFMDSQRGT